MASALRIERETVSVQNLDLRFSDKHLEVGNGRSVALREITSVEARSRFTPNYSVLAGGILTMALFITLLFFNHDLPPNIADKIPSGILLAGLLVIIGIIGKSWGVMLTTSKEERYWFDCPSDVDAQKLAKSMIDSILAADEEAFGRQVKNERVSQELESLRSQVGLGYLSHYQFEQIRKRLGKEAA